MNYYPQNTVTQYTTKFNGQIELELEVGLTEISFPFNVDNVLEGECYLSNTIMDTTTVNLKRFKIALATGYYGINDYLAAGLHDAQVL